MYVKITNGTVDQYPYTVGNLRRDNPNTSFPRVVSTELLESYGLYSVTTDAQPTYNERTQTIVQNDTPTGSGSSWNIGWTVLNKTAEQIEDYDGLKASTNRDLRNELLKNTDYMALSDVTMSTEIATYRQALRDITSHANWPHLDEADWPTKP
jgi:hypothetical protein